MQRVHCGTKGRLANKTMEPTPSRRSRSGFLAAQRARGSARLIVRPLVRQAQLGAFLQGESPCGVRINHPLLPSVATATEEVETPNESVEAYTGKHADRRRDRALLSLIQPRYGV